MFFRTTIRWVLIGLVCLGLVGIPGLPAAADHAEPADELLFYRDDGLFRFYDVKLSGAIGSPVLAGSGYSKGWSSITAVDLEGDGQDELLFYRDDGLFRFYDVKSSGAIGGPVLSGSGYSKGWSSITAVDLEGDGQDELLFYRDDGLFRFYDVKSSGAIGGPVLSGSGYSKGWSSITAVDLEGDGQDELLFYRDDGLFRFYDVKSSGAIGGPVLSGSGYSKGWSSITAVDLEGDGQDELLFYRDDGLFRFYDVKSSGAIGSPVLSGSGYSKGWSSVVAVNLDEIRCDNPFTAARVASLERRFPNQSFTAYVYDTRSGCIFEMNSSSRLRTASVFKVMVMAGTLLEAQNDGRSITSWERSQLVPMITESANGPVRALSRHFGGSPWFARQAQIFGLEDTRTVGDGPGAWGTTTTSAEDQVELLRQVLLGEYGPLTSASRAEAWGLMTSVVPSQTWGITEGVPAGWTVAQKNGFAGHIANSVGFVQQPGTNEGYLIAVLSNGWPIWTRGVPVVGEIAGWVSQALAH